MEAPVPEPFSTRRVEMLRRSVDFMLHGKLGVDLFSTSVDFDAADNCRLYVTAMKTMTFQDGIPSILFQNFKDHYLLVFDLTSMQDATKNCHDPELVEEPSTRKLNINYPPEYVNEVILLRERMSLVVVDKFGVVGRIYTYSLQQKINRIPLL